MHFLAKENQAGGSPVMRSSFTQVARQLRHRTPNPVYAGGIPALRAISSLDEYNCWGYCSIKASWPINTMNTKTQGAKAEGAIMAALLKEDRKVLIPFGENSRYDMAIDEDGRLIRIQCKTARLSADRSYLKFNACSSSLGVRKDYRGQIEFFGVYSPALDKCYLIPVEECGKTEDTIRLIPSKSRNPKQKHKDASIYELGNGTATVVASLAMRNQRGG